MIDGISRLYGIVVSIEGDIVTLQLRNGKTLPVDLTEALYNSESVVPVVGKAVVVTGKFAASGVLHAHAMLRAKRASKLWKPDSGPQ
jgi:hypothetical protein